MRMDFPHRLNPYFIGLPILIMSQFIMQFEDGKFQSLFYWITYSYIVKSVQGIIKVQVSILILLDYLFL